MSVIITYPFDDTANYSFDSNKMQVSGGKANLILENNTGQNFAQNFSSDVGFTYDSDKAEFTGGLVRQKDTRPVDATLYAGFPVDEDSSWANGSLNNSLIGGAIWDNGKIDLTGGLGKRLNMPATGNFDDLDGSGSRGCMRFTYIPNYTGAPSVQGHILELDTPSGNNNAIFIRHYGPSAPDYISIDLRDSSGTAHWMYTAAMYFNQGQEYIFELNFDFDEVSRFFIDGIQVSSLNTSSWIRTNAGGTFKWGGDSGTGDFFIKDIVLFDDVQHTTNHAGELPYSYENTIYVTSELTLPNFNYSGVGSIQSFTDFQTTEINAPRYTLNDLYWTGSAWTASSSTYATASPESDITTNILTLPAADTITTKIYFDDSNTAQMSVDNLDLEYTGQIYPTDDPKITPKIKSISDIAITLAEIKNIVGNDYIRYTMSVDGVEKYWDGVDWSNSDGSTQFNTLTEINDNLSTLDLEFGKLICPVAYLHSDDGSTTPELEELSLTYNIHGELPTDPNVCEVFGYVYSNNGSIYENATVRASLIQIGEYNQELTIRKNVAETVTDQSGYWSMTLVENASMQSSIGYKFEFRGTGLNESFNKIVPNETIKNFLELVDL